MPIPAGAPAAVVTLDEVKAHLQMSGTALSGTDSDAELQDTVDAAVDLVEGLVGPLLAESVSAAVTATPSGVYLLPTFPVVSVTSITATDGTVFDTAYVTVSEWGVVSPVVGSVLPLSATVVYTAGRATLPASVKQAVLELVAHLWGSQRAFGAARPFGGVAVEEETGRGASTYAVPYRVQELLQRYRLPPGVA